MHCEEGFVKVASVTLKDGDARVVFRLTRNSERFKEVPALGSLHSLTMPKVTRDLTIRTVATDGSEGDTL